MRPSSSQTHAVTSASSAPTGRSSSTRRRRDGPDLGRQRREARVPAQAEGHRRRGDDEHERAETGPRGRGTGRAPRDADERQQAEERSEDERVEQAFGDDRPADLALASGRALTPAARRAAARRRVRAGSCSPCSRRARARRRRGRRARCPIARSSTCQRQPRTSVAAAYTATAAHELGERLGGRRDRRRVLMHSPPDEAREGEQGDDRAQPATTRASPGGPARPGAYWWAPRPRRDRRGCPGSSCSRSPRADPDGLIGDDAGAPRCGVPIRGDPERDRRIRRAAGDVEGRRRPAPQLHAGGAVARVDDDALGREGDGYRGSRTLGGGQQAATLCALSGGLELFDRRRGAAPGCRHGSRRTPYPRISTSSAAARAGLELLRQLGRRGHRRAEVGDRGPVGIEPDLRRDRAATGTKSPGSASPAASAAASAPLDQRRLVAQPPGAVAQLRRRSRRARPSPITAEHRQQRRRPDAGPAPPPPPSSSRNNAPG